MKPSGVFRAWSIPATLVVAFLSGLTLSACAPARHVLPLDMTSSLPSAPQSAAACLRVWDGRDDEVLASGEAAGGARVAFVAEGDLPKAAGQALTRALALAPACGLGLRVEVRLRRLNAWLDHRWVGGDAGASLEMDVTVLPSAPDTVPLYMRQVQVDALEPDVGVLSDTTVRRLLNDTWREALRQLRSDAHLREALKARG